MRSNAVKSIEFMAKKKKDEKPLAFRDAIWLALHTPHLTHKQIDELRKQGKLLKKDKK